MEKISEKDVKISGFSEGPETKKAEFKKAIDSTNTQEVDFFKKHDLQLNAELSKFYALTRTNPDRSQLMDLRDKVMDHSEDYKSAVTDLKDFITEKVGFEPPAVGTNEIIHAEVETATITKLLNSMDALIYRDLLDNKGQEYGSLLKKRDAFTTSEEKYIESFDKMVNKSNELEAQHEPRGVLTQLKEAMVKSGMEEKAAEIER